jgi:hypothetical protein
VKSYFVYLNYAATGEGLTHSCGLAIASTKDAAKRDFLKRTMLQHTINKKHFEESVKYYGCACQVFDLHNKKDQKRVREILDYFLTPNTIEAIIEAEDANALHEFTFHLYRNFS